MSKRVLILTLQQREKIMNSPAPHVVIVGGEFGEPAAATALRKAPTRKILIERMAVGGREGQTRM